MLTGFVDGGLVFAGEAAAVAVAALAHSLLGLAVVVEGVEVCDADDDASNVGGDCCDHGDEVVVGESTCGPRCGVSDVLGAVVFDESVAHFNLVAMSVGAHPIG